MRSSTISSGVTGFPRRKSIPRRKRPQFRPAVDGLESRLAPVAIQPSALEQVFLERMNDYRATLKGANTRPFALVPALDEFAVKASQTRNGNALKNAMDRARVPWERKNSFTAGGLHSGFAQPPGTDPARLTSAVEFLVFTAPYSSAGPWPLIGRAGNPLYKAHRIVGMNITVSGGEFTYRDITAAYKGTRPLVTGVVYRDANANGKYDVGEGLSGVSISAGSLGSTDAWDVGGYTLPVNVKRPTTITVVASGGGLPSPMTQTVSVTPGANSRLNFAIA